MNRSFMICVAAYGAGFMISMMFSNALAGNTEMVEGRVKTLDRINKEAVHKIPDIPANGRIQLEAEGTQHGDILKITVKRYTITPIEERSTQLDERAGDTVDKEKQNEG